MRTQDWGFSGKCQENREKVRRILLTYFVYFYNNPVMIQNDKSAGTLVPLKDAAEDRTPALVGIDARELVASVRDGFNGVVKREVAGNGQGGLAITLTVLCGLSFACVVTVTGVGIPMAAFLTPVILIGGCVYSNESQHCESRAQHWMKEMKSSLRQGLRFRQRNAYRNKEEHLVALADAHLEQGGLLDEKTLSYLAAAPEERLRKASDRLAVTVLQARRMLAYERGGRRDETLRPATFARFRLIPGRAEHNGLLRGKLCETDARLAEDEGPEMPLPEVIWPERIPEIENLKISKLGLALRVVAGPLFFFADRRRLRALENITLPDTPRAEAEVPALRPAADFSEALARYERDVERLDLPALRGAGGASGGRLLPGRAVSAPRP